jgi:hypothetical protein
LLLQLPKPSLGWRKRAARRNLVVAFAERVSVGYTAVAEVVLGTVSLAVSVTIGARRSLPIVQQHSGRRHRPRGGRELSMASTVWSATMAAPYPAY